jgi:hypothetical protein
VVAKALRFDIVFFSLTSKVKNHDSIRRQNASEASKKSYLERLLIIGVEGYDNLPPIGSHKYSLLEWRTVFTKETKF